MSNTGDNLKDLLKTETDEIFLGGLRFDSRMREGVWHRIPLVKTKSVGASPSRRILGRALLSAAAVAAFVLIALASGRVLRPPAIQGQDIAAGSEDRGTPSDSLSGSKRLNSGSLEEAEAALGFDAWSPGYLPEGAKEDAERHWSQGTLFSSYRIGKMWFEVTQRRAPVADYDGPEALPRGVTRTKVSGFPAWEREVRPEPSDTVSDGNYTVGWLQGGYEFGVSGGLGLKDELLKVAKSLSCPGR